MKQHQSSHFEYEFFGPYGAALLVLALPCVVLGLVYVCNSEGCVQLSHLLSSIPGFPSDQPLYSHAAMAAVVGWFCLVLLLHVVLPGDEAQGVLLPSGRRLTYKLNGEQAQAEHSAVSTVKLKCPTTHYPKHQAVGWPCYCCQPSASAADLYCTGLVLADGCRAAHWCCCAAVCALVLLGLSLICSMPSTATSVVIQQQHQAVMRHTKQCTCGRSR
jgi:hypothetical protein